MKKLLVLFTAVALVGFAVPVMAVDWNFYGSARMATYWTSVDNGTTKVQDLQWDFQGNSRIGAKVKGGPVEGQFELGLGANGNVDVDATTRRLYGTWDFGPGKLKVGKDYTPLDQFISGQAFNGDLGLLGVGTMYAGRPGQVALSLGGFDIALITPEHAQISTAQGSTTAGTTERVVPKVEASYGMSFDAFNFAVRGGWQYYKIKDVVSLVDGTNNDLDVYSYIVGADAGFNFGPAYVKGAVSYGSNVGSARWDIPGLFTSGAYAQWDGDDNVDDVTTLMAALVAGLKVSDMLSFEAGVGYRQDDPGDAPNGFDNKTKVWSYYGQAVIAMAPGVWLIPEVGYYDFGKSATDANAGNEFYAGGKWQIDF